MNPSMYIHGHKPTPPYAYHKLYLRTRVEYISTYSVLRYKKSLLKKSVYLSFLSAMLESGTSGLGREWLKILGGVIHAKDIT